MADGTIDCDFPVWGLLPKKETGVVSFLNKYEKYDGRDTVIAIFDSGVDPAAEGLKVTTTGETKVIERFDCSGCGDVDTSTVITEVVDGCITGLTGRKLTLPEGWKNPSKEWRVGILYPYQLYPTKLRERVQEHRRETLWDVYHKPAFAKANKELQEFESKFASTSPSSMSLEDRQTREELEARVDVLQTADKKYVDVGPSYDCVLYHDGTVWRAGIDISECGDLASGVHLAEYSATHEHAHLTPLDEMTVSVNVHDAGATLEVVGMCSTHGTHVAAIAAGHCPARPELSGVAPGARVVSLTIGDARLGSMETGTALVRACIKVMELSKTMKIDVINMSYGEHAHWCHSGRIGEIINTVVSRYGVSWVVSAGNHGPALGTVGAPPDIAHDVLIGVGAYVSADMMSAAYSLRRRAAAGAFSWSSRGPAPSGGAGVSVAAPGGAVASVARFTLRNSQLMNGTSMAAPHVAGAIAALISGLKQRGLPYSPHSVKRALQSTAAELPDVEPWAQGAGLLNVEKAFEHLITYHAAAERDATFAVSCGPGRGAGVLLRPRPGDAPRDVSVSVEPVFVHDHDDVDNVKELVDICNEIPALNTEVTTEPKACSIIKERELHARQLSFSLRVALSGAPAWLSAPRHVDLSNAPRALSLRVDTAALPPGAHFASLNAYDVSCPDKGPVFRVPVTVLQPAALAGAAPALAGRAVLRAGAVRRVFAVPPPAATWAVLRMTTADQEATGRFLIHTMQLLPRRSCRAHETQKMLNLSADAPITLPFPVVSGVTLEVCLAKYWANIGELDVEYSVTFHGLEPAGGARLWLHGAAGVSALLVRALTQQDVQPSAVLKHSESVLRPTESKLCPLSARDVLPPATQIYQLINTYTFTLAKGTEVSPAVSMLSDTLYEAEVESQMWMLYNSHKQLLAVGDAYPSKYTVKLEKGEYTLRLGVRHAARGVLERLAALPVLLQARLPAPLALDVYADHSLAVTGGKKMSSTTVASGDLLPIYIAGVPSDKISRSNVTLGQTLTGTLTLARDELGRRADVRALTYVVAEFRKQPKDKDKDKKTDEYADAALDLAVAWMAKLEGDKLEQLYAETTAKHPAHPAPHLAYLAALDPPADPKRLPHAALPDMTPALCNKIIAIADKVINEIDQEKLLAYLGVKNDARQDASKIKQEHEKQRGYLIEALSRRGTALCRLAAAPAAPGADLAALADNTAALLKYTDLTDAKAIHYGVWHCFTVGHWARACKLLAKILEDKPSRDADDCLAAAQRRAAWPHAARHAAAAAPARYPPAYRPF